MELLKEKLKNKKYGVAKTDSTWYREISKEMSGYFKTNCYWIPYKFDRHKIYDKFKIARREKRNFRYFLGMLQN
jgi:hypothetical protein